MNPFDKVLIKFINGFAQQSWLLDKFFVFLANNCFFKGGVIITLIWWAWFKKNDKESKNRKLILVNLISSFFSMAFARFLAYVLPFRFRPMHNENLNFILPHGMTKTVLEGWSSFPSDHAVLYFTIATGLLFISRRVGLFAILYTTFFIALPRIYVGYHYPTDLIAGAIIGVIFAVLAVKYFASNKYIDKLFEWTQSKPCIFYPLFFLFSYQVADIFDGVRAIGNAISIVIEHLIN